MRFALLLLLPALTAQADPWLLRFTGFTAAESARAEAFDKLFRGQLEAMSDEPKAGFQVLDEGHVDVSVSATQTLEGKELVFHWFLATTECPGRTLEHLARLPKAKVDKAAARKMLGEVLAQADLLRRGKVGKKSASCTEEGDAYADMPSNSEDAPKPKPKAKPAAK